MRRWLSLLLAGFLVCAAMSAFGESEPDEELFLDEEDFLTEDASQDETLDTSSWVSYDYNHLTIGNTTHLTGQFFTDLWGNTTSDIDVRQLVTGYNLVKWDGDLGFFRFDHSVVSGAMMGDDAAGDRRYLISLYDDLHYSDGTPVTAWDYAFSVLLQCSPVIEKLGGVPARFDFLVGFEEYLSGEASALSGLRVVNDQQLLFIVKKESLPYFYELGRFMICPYPIQTIAPGCKVYDSKGGTYIGNADPSIKEPLFTETLLQGTIMDAQTGYLIHPSPGTGPYTLISYDGETANFTINPWYKGNEDGVKPKIRNLTYTWAHNETMVRELGNGSFALLNKATLAETIRQGLELCTTQNQFTRSTYPRVGLTYFYYMPTSEKVQSLPVRQAMAHCLNKAQFLSDYVGYYGLQADGMYGLGQWMYQLAAGTMLYPVELPENPTAADQKAYDEALEAWSEITLDHLTTYPLDLDRANVLLDEAGWNLNEAGQLFTPGKDALRYRRMENELVPLKISIAYTKADESEQPLTTCFLNNLKQAGVQATLVPTTIDQIGEVMDGTVEAPYDLLYLGNNFSSVFNPARMFEKTAATRTEEMAKDSIPAVSDELRKLALEMDATEPSDLLGYMQKWLRFQERLSETLPILPVYMNVYFDFYTRELQNYWIGDVPTWADAIVAARMSRFDDAIEDMDELLEDYTRMTGNEAAESAASFNLSHREKTDSDTSEGALSTFPKKVRDQIPSEYRTINEFITATLSTDYENVKSAVLHFTFETRYPADETVYLLFGIVDENNNVEWMVQYAQVNQEGSVDVTLEKDQLDRLAGHNFALVVVSKE